MKLTANSQRNQGTHKPKRIEPIPKAPGQFSECPDPPEDQQSTAMDEVRRQVVLMSSRGFREAVRPRPSMPSAKGQGRKQHTKPRRGATE